MKQGETYYDKYEMNRKEWMESLIVTIMVAALFSYVFYQSRIAFLIMLLPFPRYLSLFKKYLVKKRRQELTLQFKEFCISLSAQLMAGYAMENAIHEAAREMKQMYTDAFICQEMQIMETKMKLNITIEKCFEDFGVRSGIEEIRLFAQILKVAKRSGGDVIEIVKNSANTISQKIDVEREVRMILHAKKYEQRVMDAVPVLMILYVDHSSELMGVMYHGMLGRLVMTGCLLIYIVAFLLGEKITDREE